MFLLLTLNIFTPFSSVSFVEFEQVNVSRVIISFLLMLPYHTGKTIMLQLYNHSSKQYQNKKSQHFNSHVAAPWPIMGQCRIFILACIILTQVLKFSPNAGPSTKWIFNWEPLNFKRNTLTQTATFQIWVLSLNPGHYFQHFFLQHWFTQHKHF